MKKLLGLLLLTTPIFAEISSVERPSTNHGRDVQLEILGSMDHRLGEMSNQLAYFKANFIEQQRTNEILNILNDNLGFLISEVHKSNEHLEHILWNQGHKLSDISPLKKGS